MEIQKTYNDGVLTIAISGRVDAAEAAKLQKELLEITGSHDDAESLVIDATAMSFISSMGLRVFLTLKKNHENMKIVGANPDVYNVFKITGFHKIITIEKALRNVSIDGCELVNGTKDVYRLTEDTVLKVFPEGTTKADVDNEVKMAKEVFVLGVPTAMAFDIVMVGDRYGLIYERTTTMEISAPELGDMIRNLHEQVIEPDGEFSSLHAMVKKRINTLAPYLGDEAVEKLQQMLSVLPDSSALLHGKLRLECIMKQNEETIFTDMGDAGYGNPVLDLAHLYSTLTEEQRGEYFDIFMGSYYDMESEETIRRNRENITLLSMIADFTRLTSEGEPSEAAVEAAKKDFQERVADRWEEILSRLRFKMDFNEEMRKLERDRFYLRSDVNIDWVASRLATNRHYVSDYFNKVLHTTFNEYINTMRLEYAVQLIREGRTQKSQICYEAGFNNDHTFRRLFKQKYGCLPSQYLENHE